MEWHIWPFKLKSYYNILKNVFIFSAGIVSLISLAVLSYERYCTMMGSTEADATNYKKVAIGVVLSWVYSLIWTLPPLFGWSRYGPEGPGTTCSVDWTTKTANNISYIICLFIFCLIVPFLVIVFCYGKLLLAIKQVSETLCTSYLKSFFSTKKFAYALGSSVFDYG